MTGNTPDLNNPGNTNGNINSYPNAQFTRADLDIEPSIRGKQLYIPIDAFFCESSKTCLPLIALQFQSVSIRVILKPIMDLYTINNIDDIPMIMVSRIEYNQIKMFYTIKYGGF